MGSLKCFCNLRRSLNIQTDQDGVHTNAETTVSGYSFSWVGYVNDTRVLQPWRCGIRLGWLLDFPFFSYATTSTPDLFLSLPHGLSADSLWWIRMQRGRLSWSRTLNPWITMISAEPKYAPVWAGSWLNHTAMQVCVNFPYGSCLKMSCFCLIPALFWLSE